MNPFDILAAIIFSYCLIRGLFRGLIKEVSSLIGVLAGFYAAYTYYPLVSNLLRRWMSDSGYMNIIGFLVIFCAVFFVISILGVIVKYLLNIASLGWVDRICGVGFGAMKGILIVSVILMIFTAFLPKGAGLLKNSTLAPHVMRVAEKMIKVVPGDMKTEFRKKLEVLRENWKILN
jgi:membrane protein required for colicin V production